MPEDEQKSECSDKSLTLVGAVSSQTPAADLYLSHLLLLGQSLLLCYDALLVLLYTCPLCHSGSKEGQAFFLPP